jgi:hypothetical protein
MAIEYVIRDGKRIEVETICREAPKRRRQRREHIGCPLKWLRRISPLVKTKEQLMVALWLHRRRAVCRSDLFTVPNDTLEKELGLSRYVKYKALRHLEMAKIITVVHNGKNSLAVRFLNIPD